MLVSRPVLDASSCIGSRRLHSREILSGIGADGGKHHNKDPDEPSNDADARARSIEIPYLVDTICNSGSSIRTKPQEL